MDFVKNKENTFNFVEGRSEWEILINRMAQGVFEQTNAKRKDLPIIEQALKEGFENIITYVFSEPTPDRQFKKLIRNRISQ